MLFFDTMSDFNVPGSPPKKHDEISEIDRKAEGTNLEGTINNDNNRNNNIVSI